MLNYIDWNADPEIFTIFGREIRWYGLLFAISFVSCYYILLDVFKKENIKQETLDKLTMYVFFGTLLGARLGHCLFYEPAFYLSHPFEILYIWKGGLASHGAAIGITLFLYLFARKEKRPFLWVFDRVTMVVPLAGAFVRLGNLMNSEIVGKPTDLPWGFVFKRLGEDFARHPSQLYESFGYLIIFAILFILFQRKNYASQLGFISGWFLSLLFGFRFFIEYTKEVQVGFERTMALDMGQILSIPFVMIGIFLIIYSLKHNKVKQ